MQLKEFSLFVPNVESGKVLKALETAIPSERDRTGDRRYKIYRRTKTSFTITFGSLFNHRSLMFQVADRAQISPLRLSFTGTLNVVRRAIPKFQRIEPEEIPFF